MLRLLRFFCFQADRCQILQQRLQTKGVSKKEVNSDAVFDICIARPVISQYMWLHFDAIYVSVCGSESEPFFVCGIKIDAIFGSGMSAVALKLMPFLITSSLIPSGKGHFLSSFQKISAHLTHGWRSFCQPIRREFLL